MPVRTPLHRLGRATRHAALLVLAVPCVPSDAGASCVPSITFGQLTQACGGGTAYCYVLSPGSNATHSILGSFWSLGSGNPATGAGNDNGAWPAEEAWLQSGLSGAWLSGDWNAPQIDGCIAGAIAPGESSEIMVLGLSDQDIFASRGFFAAAAVGRIPSGTPQFDFAGGIQRDILMAQIPRASFYMYQDSLHFFAPPAAAIAPGFYTDGSASIDQVIVGYRIYRRVGWPAAQDQRRSAWTAFSPVIPLNQEWVSGCVCCGGDSRLEFATALVFSGGFESAHVSKPWKGDPCIPENVFDLDGDGHYSPEWGGDDCDDDDPTVYPGAPEVNDGQDNQCPFSPGYGSIDEISGRTGFYDAEDKTRLTWWVQDAAALYEVARSDRADFVGGCAAVTTPLTTWSDPQEPPKNGVFHYLVRAATPHAGSWGVSSTGVERTVSCP